MSEDNTRGRDAKWARHPAWALAMAAGPLFAALLGGPRFNDDAFITFRYAQNIASGLGFVYNPGEAVLGTTTPLLTFWLAFCKYLHISILHTALVTGVAGGIMTSVLLWRIAVDQDLALPGLLAGLLLSLFPRWWMNMLSGMETAPVAFAGMLYIWLDQRERPGFCGLTAAAVILLRPDAAALVAAVLIVRFFISRFPAAISAMVTALFLLPWITYSSEHFGSVVPHSILAKQLIHPYPALKVLEKIAGWFVSDPSLILLSVFWLCGAAFVILRKRNLLSLVVWPLFFFIGMALSQVGPFYWYKIPLLPGYFLLSFIGLDCLLKIRSWPGAKWRGIVTALVALVIAVFWSITALTEFRGRKDLDQLNAKERIYMEMVSLVKSAPPAEKSEHHPSVFVGDVGVLGYYLNDFYIIDSAGINSIDVYEIRKADHDALVAQNPVNRWDWWGTRGWSRAVLKKYRPDFIASDAAYLHLPALLNDPGFKSEYETMKTWPQGERSYILLRRKNRD